MLPFSKGNLITLSNREKCSPWKVSYFDAKWYPEFTQCIIAQYGDQLISSALNVKINKPYPSRTSGSSMTKWHYQYPSTVKKVYTRGSQYGLHIKTTWGDLKKKKKLNADSTPEQLKESFSEVQALVLFVKLPKQF